MEVIIIKVKVWLTILKSWEILDVDVGAALWLIRVVTFISMDIGTDTKFHLKVIVLVLL